MQTVNLVQTNKTTVRNFFKKKNMVMDIYLILN
jgi:hypothetical protein